MCDPADDNFSDGHANSDVKRRVAYISSLDCIRKCDCLPKVKGRVVLVFVFCIHRFLELELELD